MSDVPAVVKTPDQKYCSACAKLLHVSAASCPFCGASQGGVSLAGVVAQQPGALNIQKAADQKFCAACGQVVHQSATSCPQCGAVQPGVAAAIPKSRTAAVLWAVFLGGFGAHKFYTGKLGWGFLYLVFCWTYVPAVVSLVEAIWYVTLDDEQFNLRVVSKS